MSITRTYAVGIANKVRRLDNHIGPWVDISIPVAPGHGLSMNCLDVITDPTNSDRVVVVGDVLGGNTGIMVSYNAGATWFKPAGPWERNKVNYKVWWVGDVVWVIGDSGNVLKSIDGGSSFGPAGSPIAGGLVEFTNTIHALDGDTAVVAGCSLGTTSDNTVKIWKTINGGSTWFELNGGNSLTNLTNVTGLSNGVWISDDEQEIIVTCYNTQHKATSGGLLVGDFLLAFTSFTSSGKHLTWYPSYGDPTFFRHVGGSLNQVSESIDTGATWAIGRTGDGITIEGAHFYSETNGYYVVGGEVFLTTDGGLTGTVSDSYFTSLTNQYNAVWTQLENEVYCLTNCQDETSVVYSSEATLLPYIGGVAKLDITGYDATICWSVAECVPPDGYVEIELNSILSTYADCPECVATLETCYDLISCNGTCDDILDASLPTIEGLISGGLVIVTDGVIGECIFNAYVNRVAYFMQSYHVVLSDPAGGFQLGSDNYTFGMTSLVYNGTEYLGGPVTPYVMNPVNYDPVECVGDVCTSVAPNTTENSWTNFAEFLNTQFTANALMLEATAANDEDCLRVPAAEKDWFKIKYHEGDSFSITTTVTNNAGTQTWVLDLNPGDVAIDTGYGGLGAIETCTFDANCDTVALDLIELYDGDCPVIPEPPVVSVYTVTPRLGEVGFSWNNCDPDTVIGIKSKYADSVYAMFKRMKYGINTCCEYDLDKIDIKNSLLDLGKNYDPDACEDVT